jgi:glycosyltransferase involved in cell wall biosynthesis
VRCNMPIKIAAKIDRVDREYFDREISPLLELPGVSYIGEISDAEKSGFLSGAAALLMPIDWPEPFGLVMIEAMACGTPVIAYSAGSVPEIVEDGVTGFVVRNELEAADTIRERLGALSRADIRARFEARFSARRMALEYLDAYRSLVANSSRRLRLVRAEGARISLL